MLTLYYLSLYVLVSSVKDIKIFLLFYPTVVYSLYCILLLVVITLTVILSLVFVTLTRPDCSAMYTPPSTMFNVHILEAMAIPMLFIIIIRAIWCWNELCHESIKDEGNTNRIHYVILIHKTIRDRVILDTVPVRIRSWISLFILVLHPSGEWSPT